jgi:UDP-N-acetylglucosamine 2-epimerase
MKILHVVGARPNFMKTAPIMREMAKHPQEFEQLLVYTGQHYDDNMSQVFFEELELPQPDTYLGVGGGGLHFTSTTLRQSSGQGSVQATSSVQGSGQAVRR